MADRSSTVELIFQGIDRTGEATQAALRNAQSFTNSLQSATAPIADFTKRAVQVEAALLTAGAAITAFSIKAAGDFDSAFREITTLIDEPIGALDEFRQGILDYANESTQPLEQVTTAIYSAISAGVDYTDAIEAVAQAEQLAVAGKADLNDTLTVLVSSLNAYGMEMDEAERFSDALFTTVRQGQTTLPELGSSLAQVTGLAASAGVDFEELLSAVAALTAAGTPTSQAVTQVRQAIANIINPTQQARTMAADLGIEFGAAALESRGLEGVLDDVAQATGGNTEQMSQLFGSVQALGAVLTLTGEGAGAFGDTLRAMEDNTGATGQAFENMAGTVEQNNQRVINAMRGMAIEIGGPLLDQYGSVTGALAAVFNAVGQNVQQGQLGGLVGVVEGIMSDTEATLRTIAENMGEALELADLSGFERGIEALREGVQNLFQNQDLSSAEGLADAMTTIADAFAGLSQFTAGVIESFRFLFDLLVDVGSGAASLDDSLFRTIGNMAGIVTQVNMLLPLFEKLLFVMVAAQGVGLINSTRQLTTALGASGLAGALSRLGAVGAAGAGGWMVGDMIGDGIDALIDRFTDSGNLGGLIYDLIHPMEDLTVATENMGRTSLKASEDLDKSKESLEDTGRDYDRIVNEMTAADDMARESKRLLTEQFEAQGLQWDATTGKIGETKEIIDGTEESNRRWVETMEDGVRTFTQVGPAVGESMDRAKTSTEEAAKQSDKLQIALEELASNERIRYMEFEAQMNVAELEAQTAQVEAAFDSINNTMDSTAEMLGSLFGQLGDSSAWDRLDIKSQIDRENQIREEAHQRQMKMLDEHIRNLQARTDAMQRGDAAIKIEGDGLQPHLEAFMWEILRAIQVRVNEDGLEMLTGA